MLTAHRARFLHCLSDPGAAGDPAAVEYFEDGLMLLDSGTIAQLGPADTLLPALGGDVQVIDHYGAMIVPGFIDCHVHYPQMEVIASFGTQLLDWLETYTFPAERRYSDAVYARNAAELFLDELLRNGTTTALVYATVFRQSVDAFFEAALARNLRMAAGKVLMDRNCPPDLCDTPETGYRDSRELLEKWHGQGRLRYAITPRFAPTCSEQQLNFAGKLAREFPDALVHTHLAEHPSELEWVAQLFPHSRSYLDVYQSAGLLRERAVFAHCLHLDDTDHSEMAAAGAAMAFCPTSNLFLGSGLFDLERARAHNIRVGLATDIGGGTSFSMLRTLSEAYKVLHLQQQTLSSFRGLFLATLGAAEALYMEDRIGNFAVGKEADFVVLNRHSTPLITERLKHTQDLAEEMFVQMMLGDDRAVSATYVMGNRQYPSKLNGNNQ